MQYSLVVSTWYNCSWTFKTVFFYESTFLIWESHSRVARRAIRGRKILRENFKLKNWDIKKTNKKQNNFNFSDFWVHFHIIIERRISFISNYFKLFPIESYTPFSAIFAILSFKYLFTAKFFTFCYFHSSSNSITFQRFLLFVLHSALLFPHPSILICWSNKKFFHWVYSK